MVTNNKGKDNKMKKLHKSCLSSKVIDKLLFIKNYPAKGKNYYKVIPFCQCCDRYIEIDEIVNFNTPFVDCISIIKGHNKEMADMIINAIGESLTERR